MKASSPSLSPRSCSGAGIRDREVGAFAEAEVAGSEGAALSKQLDF